MSAPVTVDTAPHNLFCKAVPEAALRCEHLKVIKTDLAAFRVALRFCNAVRSVRASVSTVAEVAPSCNTCKSTVIPRMHACLECVHFGCWGGGHAKTHADKANHMLALDIQHLEIYCFECRDYVYDASLDRIKQEVLLHPTSFATGPPKDASERMQREIVSSTSAYSSTWAPTEEETKVLRMNSKPLTGTCTAPNGASGAGAGTGSAPSHPVVGLRGLNNVGNSCFMNCILQAVIHNPRLRDFFLGDGHNRKTCPRRWESMVKFCAGCELDKLVSKVFDGSSAPFTPHSMLYSVWNEAEHLAGYEQQDAHEFLITFLNGVHGSCASPTERDCQCIVHQLFNGQLRSDWRCGVCGSISTVRDPFFELSLDIQVPADVAADDVTTDNIGGDGNGDQATPNSLFNCLQRFTHPERLGEHQRLMCAKCNKHQEGVKQLSVQILPQTLVLHLKRFDHSAVKAQASKINTFTPFPLLLDMAPFRPKQEGAAVVDSEWYELFAVVSHIGQSMGVGHYVTFLQQGGVWFRCDDGLVRQVATSAVLESQAYVLFYMHKPAAVE